MQLPHSHRETQETMAPGLEHCSLFYTILVRYREGKEKRAKDTGRTIAGISKKTKVKTQRYTSINIYREAGETVKKLKLKIKVHSLLNIDFCITTNQSSIRNQYHNWITQGRPTPSDDAIIS